VGLDYDIIRNSCEINNFWNEAMKINAGELKKGDIILRHGLQLLNEPKQRD
jgi:hypothetical protein